MRITKRSIGLPDWQMSTVAQSDKPAFLYTMNDIITCSDANESTCAFGTDPPLCRIADRMMY